MRKLETPAPSIAAGAGPFIVDDSAEDKGGCSAPPVQGNPGLFQSPYSVCSPLALGIRAHEYGHLGMWRQRLEPSLRCIQKLRHSGIHEVWIQGSLDVVVNHFMMARGNRDIQALLLWSGLCLELPRWVAANLYVRGEGLRFGSLMRMSILARQADLTSDDLAVLDEASQCLAQWGREQRPVPEKEYREMLRELQRRFGPDSATAEHPMAQMSMSGALVERKGEEASAIGDGAETEGCLVTEGLVVSTLHRPEGVNASVAGTPWGSMDILTPPLTHRCRKPGGMARRKLVCGYMGAFRFPTRALLPAADGRAFSHRRGRSRGGTLLIDCSGSMSEEVTHERLMAVLARCPSATIALYAGGPESLSGSLLIAARGGMHVEREVIEKWPHGGNVVDGPALQWLSQQKAPRIWVSDGSVTGVGDTSASNLSHEAEILTARAQIRRVPRLDVYLGEMEED